MTASFQYVRPRHVDNPEDCIFYHAMDLPGIGTVEGHWDLRSTAEAYLGGFDFAGKRALDMGTAGGFLTFEMEKRGATVVSFDVGDETLLNLVPFVMPGYDIDRFRSEAAGRIDRVRNGYWLAHRRQGSQAQAFYGDVYNLPDALGSFDVVVFGMILPHLRDPFQALYSGSRRSREWLLITQQALDTPEAKMVFMPDPVAYPEPRDWWFMSDGCIERMLRVLGFELMSRTRSSHFCATRRRTEECTTYIARRQSVLGAESRGRTYFSPSRPTG